VGSRGIKEKKKKYCTIGPHGEGQYVLYRGDGERAMKMSGKSGVLESGVSGDEKGSLATLGREEGVKKGSSVQRPQDSKKRRGDN